jgi:hypothetical protein
MDADAGVTERLERLGADGACPSCGPKNGGLWLLPPDAATAAFTLDNLESIGIQPLICPHCGFVRLHAKAFLEDDYLEERAEQDASR